MEKSELLCQTIMLVSLLTVTGGLQTGEAGVLHQFA